jgi:hypothetical protein
MRNGCLYPPLSPGHRIAANESSSSPGLLPTPQAHDKHGAKTPDQVAAMRARGAGVRNLNEVAVNELLLRTPTAQLAANGGSQHPEKRKAGGHGPTLADQVEHQLLPTPSAQNSHGNHRRGGERSRELLLPGAVLDLLPTPSVADVTGGHRYRSGDRRNELLLPGIAEALTSHGVPTNSPSAAGSAQPAAPRHVQLSLDGPESA